MKMKNHLVAKQPRLARPFNLYNIFFFLERLRLIQLAGVHGASGKAPATQRSSSPGDSSGFDQICLPDLPPRFHGLILPPNWFVPGRNAKRRHVATNGLRNFTTLARTVASNWRTLDDVTLSYCRSVAQILKERHAELLSHTCGGLQLNKQAKQREMTTKTSSLAGARKFILLEEKEESTPGLYSPCSSPATLDIQYPTLVSPEAKSAHEGVTTSCGQQRSLVDHNMMSSMMYSQQLPEETTSSYFRDTVPLEEVASNPTLLLHAPNVIAPIANIVDEGEDTSVHRANSYQLPTVACNNTSSTPILPSMMSSQISTEETTSMNFHDMLQPRDAVFCASNDMIPLDQQLMLTAPIAWENMFDSDDVASITDSDIHEMWELLSDD